MNTAAGGRDVVRALPSKPRDRSVSNRVGLARKVTCMHRSYIFAGLRLDGASPSRAWSSPSSGSPRVPASVDRLGRQPSARQVLRLGADPSSPSARSAAGASRSCRRIVRAGERRRGRRASVQAVMSPTGSRHRVTSSPPNRRRYALAAGPLLPGPEGRSRCFSAFFGAWQWYGSQPGSHSRSAAVEGAAVLCCCPCRVSFTRNYALSI